MVGPFTSLPILLLWRRTPGNGRARGIYCCQSLIEVANEMSGLSARLSHNSPPPLALLIPKLPNPQSPIDLSLQIATSLLGIVNIVAGYSIFVSPKVTPKWGCRHCALQSTHMRLSTASTRFPAITLLYFYMIVDYNGYFFLIFSGRVEYRSCSAPLSNTPH